MTPTQVGAIALAAAAGVATVFGFAPFHLPALPIVTVALLFAQWQGAATPRMAAQTGFAFGLGLFLAGASWVYVALASFGGMPGPLAAVGTVGFCAWLALFPAATGWLAVRLTAPHTVTRAVAICALWTIAEWARGSGYAGFPWLALGYSQLPAPIEAGATALASPGSPLAGFGAVGGVWLVTLAVAACAALLALLIDAIATTSRRRTAVVAITGLAVAGAGALLARAEWTLPVRDPVAVSLVQGNFPEEIKFDPNMRDETFRAYVELATTSRGRLVVLPESAFPMFADEVPPEVLLDLGRNGRSRQGDVLVGLFTLDRPPPGGGDPHYFNSVISLGSGDIQLYRKRHLVPFGETIPLDSIIGWFIRNVLSIPLADQTPGPEGQPAFAIAGERVAVNICYEDAFGNELRPAASSATLLVNVTNDAWYGRSLAAEQHNQIAAMRALETGRPMLRATNTGITSAIDHRGREFARLPWYTRGVLEVDIAGRAGETPYLRWGDALPLVVAGVLLLAAIAASRK